MSNIGTEQMNSFAINLKRAIMVTQAVVGISCWKVCPVPFVAPNPKLTEELLACVISKKPSCHRYIRIVMRQNQQMKNYPFT